MLVYRIKYHGEAEIYAENDAEVKEYWKEAIGLDDDAEASLDSATAVGDVEDDMFEEFTED